MIITMRRCHLAEFDSQKYMYCGNATLQRQEFECFLLWHFFASVALYCTVCDWLKCRMHCILITSHALTLQQAVCKILSYGFAFLQVMPQNFFVQLFSVQANGMEWFLYLWQKYLRLTSQMIHQSALVKINWKQIFASMISEN